MEGAATAMPVVPLGYGQAARHLVTSRGNGYHDTTALLDETKDAASVSSDSPTDSIYIDADSGIPLWLQLRNRLVYLIASGKYQPGDKLPTVRALAVELGVNYNTVGKVYQDIERDGYIVSKRGKGAFVTERQAEQADADLNEVETLADEFIRQCVELGVPVEEIGPLVTRRIGVQAS